MKYFSRVEVTYRYDGNLPDVLLVERVVHVEIGHVIIPLSYTRINIA